jgi:Zn-dependent peptidase ImmA (M78 family)/DNA-binding XRE family transcriptional regulator
MSSHTEHKIIPSQLEEARKSLALSIEEVASKTGIDSSDLSKWERGDEEPSIEQLWDLARIYHRSTDYFLRQTPKFREQLNFRLTKQRTIDDLPAQTRETIVRFDELCRAETELENLLKKPTKLIVEKMISDISPEQLATGERQRLQLDNKPIKDLRKVLTGAGVRIFMLPIKDKKISGLSWWHHEYGPCILINAYDEPRGRRAFTIAHEYAHLVRGHPPTICDLELHDPEEHYANRFASYFLIPATDLKKEFGRVVGIAGTLPNDLQLGILASRYSVSLEALSRRLEELGLIPQGSTDRYIAEWSLRPSRFRGARGPRWRRQLGEKFVSLTLEAHSEGHLALGKLARYLGIDARKALDIAEAEEKPKSQKAEYT